MIIKIDIEKEKDDFLIIVEHLNSPIQTKKEKLKTMGEVKKIINSYKKLGANIVIDTTSKEIAMEVLK